MRTDDDTKDTGNRVADDEVYIIYYTIGVVTNPKVVPRQVIIIASGFKYPR